MEKAPLPCFRSKSLSLEKQKQISILPLSLVLILIPCQNGGVLDQYPYRSIQLPLSNLQASRVCQGLHIDEKPKKKRPNFDVYTTCSLFKSLIYLFYKGQVCFCFFGYLGPLEFANLTTQAAKVSFSMGILQSWSSILTTQLQFQEGGRALAYLYN